MATKKDLIEAQGFSRRRLLSAFTSGAPGGTELEPAQPLRAVAAGVALSAMIVLAGVFLGIMRPGLPAGWENNTLVLVTDTGARYITIDSVLYPVINTASARLLMPAGEFSVITTDRETLEGIEIGPTIGILGAPDDLPTADSLLNTGWASCIVGDATTALAIPDAEIVEATDDAAVVELDDRLYVVAGGQRHEVDVEDADAVLRAIGLTAASAIAVEDRWLNLFAEGAGLEPLIVSNAGDTVPNTDLTVGSVVHPEGSPDTNRYLMTASGELSPISPLAYQLYLLGSGAILGGAQDVSPAEIAALPTATTPAGGVDWPRDLLTGLDTAVPPCAVLTHDETGATATTFATALLASETPAAGAAVSSGGGALVRVGGTSAGLLYLIDESATAYPIPGADLDIIQRLGFEEEDVASVPQAWIQFLPVGPELTVLAAGASPQAAVAGGN